MLVLDNSLSKHKPGKVLIPWFYGQSRPAVAFCRERSALVNEAGIRSGGGFVAGRMLPSILPIANPSRGCRILKILQNS